MQNVRDTTVAVSVQEKVNVFQYPESKSDQKWMLREEYKNETGRLWFFTSMFIYFPLTCASGISWVTSL